MGAMRKRHSIREIATQPVILWMLLGGKPKWLPLNFVFNYVMRTAPITLLPFSLALPLSFSSPSCRLSLSKLETNDLGPQSLRKVLNTRTQSSVTQQEPLIAVEPRRLPRTNESTETAFRNNHCNHIQKSKHLLRSGVS